MATTLAKRVEKLEQEMQELKQTLRSASAKKAPGLKDWKRTIGMFKDDPTYEEAERLGRAYRRRQPKC